MKTSNKFAPALLALVVVALFGLGFGSPVGKVMAEGVAEAVQVVTAVQEAAVQANAKAADQDRQCEEREVEADEGYGVSSKVIRLFCR